MTALAAFVLIVIGIGLLFGGRYPGLPGDLVFHLGENARIIFSPILTLILSIVLTILFKLIKRGGGAM